MTNPAPKHKLMIAQRYNNLMSNNYLEILARRELINKVIALESSKSWRYTKILRIVKMKIKEIVSRLRLNLITKNTTPDLRNCLILFAPVSCEYGSLTGIQRVIKNICASAKKDGKKYYFLSIKNNYMYITKKDYHLYNHDSKTNRYNKNIKNIILNFFIVNRRALIENCKVDSTTQVLFCDFGITKPYTTDELVITYFMKNKQAIISTIIYDFLGIEYCDEQFAQELSISQNFDWIYFISDEVKNQYLEYGNKSRLTIDSKCLEILRLGSTIT
jgi:hypothetical protein